jgi:hypothetical protein
VVAALRGYGRLPTARPPGGISSGRLFGSPSLGRSASAAGEDDDDEVDDAGPPQPPQPRARRQRQPTSRVSASPNVSRGGSMLPGTSPMDWQAALHLPPLLASQLKQEAGLHPTLGSGNVGAMLGEATPASLLLPPAAPGTAPGVASNGLPPLLPLPHPAGQQQEQPTPEALALAQQAQLQALSAALMGGVRAPSALSGGGSNSEHPAGAAGGLGRQASVAAPAPTMPAAAGPAAAAGAAAAAQPSAAMLFASLSALPAAPAGASGGSPLGAFEAVLWQVMTQSHQLARPEDMTEGAVARPLHSGPKGQSGFKGVTLYKRCQRYNAHIWLGKQTHIGARRAGLGWAGLGWGCCGPSWWRLQAAAAAAAAVHASIPAPHLTPTPPHAPLSSPAPPYTRAPSHSRFPPLPQAPSTQLSRLRLPTT